MQVTIIGLGLIGGSVALDLRGSQFSDRLVGVEANPEHARRALERHLVDAIRPLDQALPEARLIVLAVPVDAIVKLLPTLLSRIAPDAVVLDLGSTKSMPVAAVRDHPRRGRYVALHPMAGTENSGPDAALAGLFRDHTAVVCDAEDSDNDALDIATRFLNALGMPIVRMPAEEHDRHVACLSHMPHVIAYALALSALTAERDRGLILQLAGGGFASIARTAKSSPAMWVPILLQNQAAILEALDDFLGQATVFRGAIASSNREKLRQLIQAANEIRNPLDGAIQPDRD